MADILIGSALETICLFSDHSNLLAFQPCLVQTWLASSQPEAAFPPQGRAVPLHLQTSSNRTAESPLYKEDPQISFLLHFFSLLFLLTLKHSFFSILYFSPYFW